jgi:hypothetical protein
MEVYFVDYDFKYLERRKSEENKNFIARKK